MIKKNSINIEPIQLIHRGKDGYVGFMRKSRETGGMENLCSIKVKDLKSCLPVIQDFLIEDSYFTVNSPHRAAPYNSKVTGFPGVWRKERHLRYLNACYCDLDIGRTLKESNRPEQWQTFGEAVGTVLKLVDAGMIPPPSIIARSGRGAYLFWILRDIKLPTDPPRAYPEKIVLYKQINRAISERLNALAADMNAVDAARVLRVPGSIHTKAGNRVEYMIQLDGNKRPFIYSLERLSNDLGIKILSQRVPEVVRTLGNLRLTLHPGSCPQRSKGFKALYTKRIDDILSIERHCGGFSKGFRWRMLCFYAECLKSAGAPEKESIRALFKMGKNCDPPYPSEFNDISISETYKKAKVGRHRFAKTLCKWMGISNEIALDLELETIIPPELKDERKNNKWTVKGIRREKRQAFIKEIFNNHGFDFSCREMVKMLEVKYGMITNRQTVMNEMKIIAGKILKEKMERDHETHFREKYSE